MGTAQLFSFKVFFVLLRETFESAIVISILLSFLNQNFDAKHPLYAKLRFQVWIGAIIGLSICLLIGAVFIALFYLIGENYWTRYERVWEAVFSIFSSLIISVMGLSLLRINSMTQKWKSKLGNNINTYFNQQEIEGEEIDANNNIHLNKKKTWFKRMTEKYSLMVLPLVTLLREGLEAIFVVTGVTASEPVSSIPLSIVLAISIGSFIGISIYKGGNKMKLQYFLIGATVVLYIVSAGLMSRGVWFFELEKYVQDCNGQDMTEIGNGPGSYDVTNVIWHVNCCSGINDGGWMLLNALVGWNNTATYGSIFSYNIYWLLIVIMLKIKLYEEKHGFLPLIPHKYQLKKIFKRYQLIKLNLNANEAITNTYSSLHLSDYQQNQNGGSRGDILDVIQDDDEDSSKPSSSLLNSH